MIRVNWPTTAVWQRSEFNPAERASFPAPGARGSGHGPRLLTKPPRLRRRYRPQRFCRGVRGTDLLRAAGLPGSWQVGGPF